MSTPPNALTRLRTQWATWVQAACRPVSEQDLPRSLLAYCGPWRMAGLAAVALTWLALAGWMCWSQWCALQTAQSEQREWQRRANESTEPALPAKQPGVAEGDFTQRLPVYPDVAPVVAELTRAAAASAVSVIELQARFTPATEHQLARHELTLQLRGSYPAIKAVLREVQARYPYCTLQRLSLRRDSSPQDILADVLLTLWGRPAAQTTDEGQ